MNCNPVQNLNFLIKTMFFSRNANFKTNFSPFINASTYQYVGILIHYILIFIHTYLFT